MFYTLFISILSLVPLYSRGNGRDNIIPGYASHGPNVWNGNQIYAMSDLVQTFFVDGNLIELGIYNPDGPIEETPLESTDPNRLVSTTRHFHELIGLPILDPTLYNRPVLEVGTSYIFSTALDDRLIPVLFEDAEPFGDLFWEKGTIEPTKGDWDSVSGQLKIRRINSNLYKLTAELCNALPNGLYTIWEAGVRNPNLDSEEFVGTPAGGLPNVIFTDNNGYGKREFFMKRDPREECVSEEGAVCTLYFAVFFHFDGMVYGGGFALSSQGLSAGVLGSNHVFFGMQGEPNFPPQNSFRQCRRNSRSDSHSDSGYGESD